MLPIEDSHTVPYWTCAASSGQKFIIRQIQGSPANLEAPNSFGGNVIYADAALAGMQRCEELRS